MRFNPERVLVSYWCTRPPQQYPATPGRRVLTVTMETKGSPNALPRVYQRASSSAVVPMGSRDGDRGDVRVSAH
ncbi:hypothetical protein DPEC_G00148450 [Dallia pectoralis]|uniref:Uncharacterized protein n=1 Tax=Dallia pectoralis TaxID=75939 RepID=A0ACC2GIV8_DALPE|nr:hypothetical protein DPEC_G00148450 [Dallia pectoralis]